MRVYKKGEREPERERERERERTHICAPFCTLFVCPLGLWRLSLSAASRRRCFCLFALSLFIHRFLLVLLACPVHEVVALVIVVAAVPVALCTLVDVVAVVFVAAPARILCWWLTFLHFAFSA